MTTRTSSPSSWTGGAAALPAATPKSSVSRLVAAGWVAERDVASVMAYAVPHAVVPQLLRRVLAPLLPLYAVVVHKDESWVTHLSLAGPRVRPHAWDAAAELPFLTSLDLSYSDAAAADLERVADLPNIQTLSLAQCPRIDAAGLAPLAAMPCLEALQLSGCPMVGADALRTVSTMEHLRRLDLVHCRHVDAAGLEHLSSMRCLEALYLSCCDVGAEELAPLVRMPALVTLSLSGCSNVGAAALELVAQIPRLRTVVLQRCPNVDAAALHVLSGLPVVIH